MQNQTTGERKSKQVGIGSAKLTVGLISGGINTNVVPDHIVMQLDRRSSPRRTAPRSKRWSHDQARHKEKHFGRLPAGDPGRTAETDRRHWAVGRLPSMPASTWPRVVISVATAKTGNTVVARVRLTRAEPTAREACAYRVEANAHSANEHIKLSDLKAATRVIEATLRDVLASK